MNAQEFQNDKLSIINWITQLQDKNLIDKIKELMPEEDFILTDGMKSLLDERLAEDKSKYKPARESLNKIKAKYYGL